MTSLDGLLTRVPVERINRQARDIHFWRTVLTILAGLLFGIGFLTAKAFGVAWLAMAWTATAVRVGWQDARKPAVASGR